jgi:hypothetical protein
MSSSERKVLPSVAKTSVHVRKDQLRLSRNPNLDCSNAALRAFQQAIGKHAHSFSDLLYFNAW